MSPFFESTLTELLRVKIKSPLAQHLQEISRLDKSMLI
nr:MAG TPA: hypothetical protein [Caudoviricetes sp.]